MAHLPPLTPAEVQFHTSSSHPSPAGYERWIIRNNYPPPKPPTQRLEPLPLPGGPVPWANIDPRIHPQRYIEVVKEYCFEGMVNNGFVPQKNIVRDWYHAAWMHYGDSGREPLHGLTSERYTPPRELSATQNRWSQNWAVGFYNSPGGSVFGGVWHDPNEPNWKENLWFPHDTVVFKLIYTNSTDEELPNMVGAPEVEAMIAVQPDDPNTAPDPKVRVSTPKKVRLLQMDIAVRDKDERSETGWLWGTFIYNGLTGKSGYDGLIPIGLSWGNDPEVTQAAFEAGARPNKVWINPAAEALRIQLHGGRPSWGWNDRLNGPSDGFISACQSCHSTAQWNPRTMSQGTSVVPPAPIKTPDGRYVPLNDKVTMKWFRDIWCGLPFTDDGAISADNSLQLMIGYENYVAWAQANPSIPEDSPWKKLPPVQRPAEPHRRQGPDMGF